MKHFQLKDMKNGWIIGDFVPNVFHTTQFEIAVKEYKAGDREQWHYHKIAQEITLIASGEVKMCGRTFTKGDIIQLAPNDATDFEAITDTITVVIKVPSVKNDKFTT